MRAYFDRFYIYMTKAQAASAFHPGQCDEDVKELLKHPKIKRQLAKISDEDLAADLRGYGAWDEEELKNREENEMRIIWIAAGNINDEVCK